MKIAVIGAGAMGSIYGGHLSLNNEVYLVDTNPEVVKLVNEKGVTLEENGEDHSYFPKAVTDTSHLPEMDLVILFVKALFSRSALNGNKKPGPAFAAPPVLSCVRSEPEFSALAPGLFDQMDLTDDHALIDGLAHIIDGEQSH